MSHKDDGFKLEERLEYLKEYGNHSMSYSTLQPKMNYYDVQGIGYIAFMQRWGTNYVLANPICDLNQSDMLVGNFLSRYPKSSFVQITKEFSEMLHNEFRFYSTQMGIETWFDLKEWNFQGKRKLIRKYRNGAKKLGLEVKEITLDDRQKLGSQIECLKSKWRKDRRVKNKEISFLVRPEGLDEPYTKRYGAFKESKILSYFICDPIWDNGKMTGYNVNLTFYDADYYKGMNYFTVNEILEDLQRQGLEVATLGLSPLRDIKPTGFDNPGLPSSLKLLYEHGNLIYNFKGLAQHKKEYHTHEIDVFYSSNKKIAFLDLFNVLKLSNLI